MTVVSGASLVTNGLVYYVDFKNEKSLVSGPITNSQWNNGSEVTPWTVGGINTDVTGMQGVPVPQAKTWKFQKTGTSNQWNGWESSYGGIWTGSAGDYWTTSYWYKTTAPAGATGFGVGSFYVSDWSRAYSRTIIDNVSSIIADGEWHYNYTVVRLDEAYTNAIIVDGPSWGYSTSAGELYINGLQWNKNSYATHWTPGTRSASQALKDLVGNRTTNTFNLTYPQGSNKSSSKTYPYLNSQNSAVITDSSNILNNDVHSIFFWIRFNTTSTYGSNGYSGSWNKIFSFNAGGSDRTPSIWRWPSERSLHWRYDPGNTGCDFGKTAAGTGNQFDIDTWYYVGVTKNGSATIMYVNGYQVGTGSVANPKTAGSSSIYLFESYPTDLASMGSLKIYDRILSSTEVLQNFNAQKKIYGL